jgi:hypothetical protein
MVVTTVTMLETSKVVALSLRTRRRLWMDLERSAEKLKTKKVRRSEITQKLTLADAGDDDKEVLPQDPDTKSGFGA